MNHKLFIYLLLSLLLSVTLAFGDAAVPSVPVAPPSPAPIAVPSTQPQITAPGIQPVVTVTTTTTQPEQPKTEPQKEDKSKEEKNKDGQANDEKKDEKKTIAEPVVEGEELSPFEEHVSGKVRDVSVKIRQFGYDLFRKPPSTFAPNDKVPVGPDYVIGPSDEIRITVWGKVEGAWNATVDRDGNINLPRVGTLGVTGLTFNELKILLHKEFSKYYKGFEMSVSMGALRTIRVYVVGHARTPGSYTVSSLSTLINALFESGGPTRLGTLRDIHLMRNGKIVVRFDVYDFLIKGDKTKDVRLQPEDVIFIPPIGSIAGIAGNVKRPAIYEMRGETKISSLIDLAGGLTAVSYLQRIQIERINNRESKIIEDKNFTEINKETDLVLQDGDLVKIFPIMTAISNSVTLEGSVTRPDQYQWFEGMRVSDLIKNPEKDLMPETYLEFALITRVVPPDFHHEVLSINLGRAINEKTEKDNIKLQPHDRIVILNKWDVTSKEKVKISGSVTNPATYGYSKNMRVSDLIKMAGGLKRADFPDSYRDKGVIIRKRSPDYLDVLFQFDFRKAVINGIKEEDVELEPSDTVMIFDSWELAHEGAVKIFGSVNNPSQFTYFQKMKVSDLVRLAGGVRRPKHPESYLSTGLIVRKRTPDYIDEVFSFKFKEIVFDDNAKEDIELTAGDIVYVFDSWELAYDAKVRVNGAVNNPGVFQHYEKMKVGDLIRLAGGLKYFAFTNEAELTRVTITRKGIDTEKKFINLERAVAGDPEHNLLLNKEDVLFVRAIPEWDASLYRAVTIGGEVKFPGTYTIIKGEKLSSVIERAGGYTDRAFLKGAVFTRERVRKLQQELLDDMVDRLERELESVQIGQTSTVSNSDELKLIQAENDQKRKFIARLRMVKAKGRVAIELFPTDKLKKTHFDMVLEENDNIFVPSDSHVVQVIGFVYSQNAFVYDPGKDVGDYIDLAGGYSSNADTGNVYVLKANGNAKRASFWGANIDSGDTIVVPEKLERIAWMRNIKDITQILYQIAVTAGVIIVAF